MITMTESLVATAIAPRAAKGPVASSIIVKETGKTLRIQQYQL